MHNTLWNIKCGICTEKNLTKLDCATLNARSFFNEVCEFTFTRRKNSDIVYSIKMQICWVEAAAIYEFCAVFSQHYRGSSKSVFAHKFRKFNFTKSFFGFTRATLASAVLAIERWLAGWLTGWLSITRRYCV